MGATPASLLDLIARGGSMQVGIDQNKERALTEAALANAVQSKAAAKELEAQTAKHNAELEAFNQAQADNQVISDAFAHVGGNRSMMDKYIKANASGAGVMRWQMENEKLREQASKASAADLDRAEKVHRVMGSSLGYLNDVPDEQLQAEYAKVAPQIQQLDPSIKLPPQIDRMGLKRIMGQLTFADEILKGQKEQAEIEGRRQQTEAATKDAALKERGAFLQAIRPDMPSEEYAAVRAAFPSAAKSFPAAPGQWIKAAAQEAVKVGDRPEVEQKTRVLAGMSPTGITAEQQARLDAEAAAKAEAARHNRVSEGLTARGQDMTDLRAREAAEITRSAAKLEAGAVDKVAELQNGINQIQSLRDTVASGSKHMGPVAGLATAPILETFIKGMGHTEPAKIKAKIDLIKQTIGKALEGGVLRKEDEVKYNAILPNMYDPLDVAESKINTLETKLKQDLKTYIDTQSAAGRRVPDMAPKTNNKDPLGIR